MGGDMRPINRNRNNFKHNTMNYLDRADELYEQQRTYHTPYEPPIVKINLKKYKTTLRLEREYINDECSFLHVYSYGTLVASGVKNASLNQKQWYSSTTQKHVNYVAEMFNMEVVKLWKSKT